MEWRRSVRERVVMEKRGPGSRLYQPSRILSRIKTEAAKEPGEKFSGWRETIRRGKSLKKKGVTTAFDAVRRRSDRRAGEGPFELALRASKGNRDEHSRGATGSGGVWTSSAPRAAAWAVQKALPPRTASRTLHKKWEKSSDPPPQNPKRVPHWCSGKFRK